MPKKPSPSQNPENEPAVRAAHITGGSARKAALITASGAVLAALLGGLWLWMSKTPPLVEKKQFVGKVSDKSTGKNIRGAKASLEGSDVPPVLYTDSEGIFSLSLNDPSKEVRIRVEAMGYEDYDRRIIPTEYLGIQEIRLEPSKNVSALSSPSPTASSYPKVSPSVKSEMEVGKYIARCRSFFDKAEYRRALAQCDEALKLEPKNQEALRLKESIQNTVKILNK